MTMMGCYTMISFFLFVFFYGRGDFEDAAEVPTELILS